MTNAKIFLYIILVSISAGCNSHLVYRSVDYNTEKSKIKKVLILPPDFFTTVKEGESRAIVERNGYSDICKAIKDGIKGWERFSFMEEDLNKYSNENIHNIFALKKEIRNAFEIHDISFNYTTSWAQTDVGESMKDHEIFVKNPKIDPKFIELSSTYQAFYFIYIGVFSTEDTHHQYIAVINMLKGEIVFCTIRQGAGKAASIKSFVMKTIEQI